MGAAFLMIFLALAFDALQALLLFLFGTGLFLNRIVTIVAWAIFAFWFWMKDVKILSFESKGLSKFIPGAVSFVSEMVPVIGALPGLTAGVAVIIMITYFEDETGLNLKEVTGGVFPKVGGATGERIPARNKEGGRGIIKSADGRERALKRNSGKRRPAS